MIITCATSKKMKKEKNWFALAILSPKLLQAPVSKNIVE